MQQLHEITVEKQILQVIQDSTAISEDQKNLLLKEVSATLVKLADESPSPRAQEGNNQRFFVTEPTIETTSKNLSESEKNSILSPPRHKNGPRPLDLSKLPSRDLRSPVGPGSGGRRGYLDSPKISPNRSTENSPKESPGRNSKNIINAIKKRRQDSLGHHEAKKQMPIDKNTAKIYLKKAAEYNDINQCIPAPNDDNYEILIYRMHKKYIKYYLICLKNTIGTPGGYATAVSAFDLETGEIAAVKIYPDFEEYLANCEIKNLQIFDRFYANAKLSDARIAIIGKYFSGQNGLEYFYNIDSTKAFHLPEYCPSKKVIPALTMLRISYKLLEQIAYFHGKKMLHRDIKPENMIINDEDGLSLTLIDLDTCVRFNQVVDTVVSTKGYIAPELLSKLKCGLMVFDKHPLYQDLSYTLKLTKNNNAVIRYNEQYFYVDKPKRQVSEIHIDAKHTRLINGFPEALNTYKEANTEQRKLIIKSTGKPLGNLYNPGCDIFQAGVVIAEMISKHNVQAERRALLNKEDQDITIETLRNLMPDVFSELNYTFKASDLSSPELFIESIVSSLIFAALQNLADQLIYTRLVKSSLQEEIERLKKIEQFCLNISDEMSALLEDSFNAQQRLALILNLLKNDKDSPFSQFSISESQIHLQIIQQFSELFKTLFAARGPEEQEPTENSSVLFRL